MMGSNATLYYRYGAYELKARYQANLLIAQLLTLFLIGSGLILSLAMPQDQRTIILPSRHRDTISIDLTIPPTINPPDRGPRPPSKPPDLRLGIPMPVDDSSAETSSMATRAELSSYLDATSLTPGTGDSDFTIETTATEFFPPRDSFIVTDSLPFMIGEIKPEYPAQAILAGLEGRVIIDALIDKEGRVREVLVRKSSGVECLDSAATKAAWKCLYRPAIQNGHPLSVWVTYPVAFRLK